MKKNVLALIAGALLSLPMVAGAVPIQYNLNYAATTGPDGIGSFVFDQDNGLMTAFNWNFGGVLGGIPDLPIPLSPGLPTRGQFIF